MTTKRAAILEMLKSKEPKRIYKLDTLPGVILGLIATFLSQQHYARFECLNSRIYIGINDNSTSSKLISLDVTYDDWSPQQIIEILKWHKNFQELRINSDYLYLLKSCTDKFEFKHLKKLGIFITDKTDDDAFFEFITLQKFCDYRKLTSLGLWGITYFDISLMYKAISMCRNLKKIETSDCHESDSMNLELPHLQCLKLYGSLAFEIIKSSGHQLKELEYWNTQAWACYGSFYENTQKVKILNKINFEKLLELKFDAVYFNEIEAIVQSAKNLEYLHMTNDGHIYPADSQQTIKNLVEVIFTKCTKLVYICLDFTLDMKIDDSNSPLVAYEGLITGLQQTVSVQREELQINMRHGMLSLKQFGEIINAFKKGNTKTMIIDYVHGCIYDDLWEECINTPMKNVKDITKQSLTDSSLCSHFFENVDEDHKIEIQFQLTLHKKI